MFGYFRPYHSGLTNSEQRLFEAYYCRICYCLRITGGQLARFFTTYDGAIYSMIMDLQTKAPAPPRLKCERLGKKNLKVFSDDEDGLRIARLSLISFGEKIRDDQIDGNGVKVKIAKLLFSRSIDAAKIVEPVIAKNAYDGTEFINSLQNSNQPIERIFRAYGDMAASAFSQFIDLTFATEELIRSVSEWIFLVDMICDYDEDYKNHTYNGFKTEGCETFKDYFDTNYLYVLSVVEKSSARLLNALLAVRDDSPVWNILYKIITHALDTVIPNVLLGKDIKFHYFSDLFQRIKRNKKTKKDIKRLGIENHEES